MCTHTHPHKDPHPTSVFLLTSQEEKEGPVSSVNHARIFHQNDGYLDVFVNSTRRSAGGKTRCGKFLLPLANREETMEKGSLGRLSSLSGWDQVTLSRVGAKGGK